MWQFLEHWPDLQSAQKASRQELKVFLAIDARSCPADVDEFIRQIREAIAATKDRAVVAGATISQTGTVFNPLLWQNNKPQALPILSGYLQSAAFSINDSGVAAGAAFTMDFSETSDPTAEAHAVLFNTDASVTDLGVLPNDRSSLATGINNSGTVVGLDIAERVQGLLELAGAPLVVQAEGGEGAMGVDDIKVDASLFGGRIGGAVEESGFEGGDAVDAPGGVGDLLDELGFGGGSRLVFVEEAAAMGVVRCLVFGGEDGGGGR
jgi:hypothetical protein